MITCKKLDPVSCLAFYTMVPKMKQKYILAFDHITLKITLIKMKIFYKYCKFNVVNLTET